MTYWDRWLYYLGQLEESGRPLTVEEALVFFEESEGVIVEPVEVLPPWEVCE